MINLIVYVSRPRNRPVFRRVVTTIFLVLMLAAGMLVLSVTAFTLPDSSYDTPLTTHHSPLTPNNSRLASIQPAPDFTLSTQTGDKLSSADLKGKVLLVSFIFTTCNGTCPATTHRMSQIQEELKSRSLFKDNQVQLLSISLDPGHDTPKVLRGYMKMYDADPAHWTFLTGPPEKVTDVIKAWGMWVKPAANGQLDHPSRIFLVDPQYRIREIYNLNFLKPKWVTQDVELLLNESQ